MMLDMRHAKRDFITLFYMREELAPTMRTLEQEHGATAAPYTLLMIDVDHFKEINDKYGHLHGDEVLQYFASTLRLDLEGLEYYPFRYGGDEFAVLFAGKKSSEAIFFAERLQRTIKKRMFLKKGKRFHITFSGGLATFPENAKTPEALIEKADQALYYSKKNGRGRTTVYNRIRGKQIRKALAVSFLVLSLGFGYWLNMDKVTLLRDRVLERISPAEMAGEGESMIHLKNGKLMRGKIAYETSVEVCLRLSKGDDLKIIKKSDISRIEYAKQPS